MQNLRFSIAAGETKVFVIAGRYLEIIDASGPVTIGLYDKNGSQTDDAKDIMSGTYMEGEFSQFEIYSATAQTVELFLTATRGGTRRQPGNVRIIDNSVAKVTGDLNQYVAAVGNTGTAGRVSWVGIKAKDPAKRIVVKRAQGGVSAAGNVSLQLASAVGATDYVEINAPPNKLSGSVDATARLFTATDQSVLTNPRLLYFGPAQAGGTFEIPLTTPIVLLPGYSLVVLGSGTGNGTFATFDFEEVV